MRSLAVVSILAVFALPVAAATIEVPSNVTQEAAGPSGAAVTYVVTANGTGEGDDHNGRPLSGPATVTCSHPSGATFPVGTTTVTCSATDSNGTATKSFNVVVTDTTGPQLQLPGDITAQASSANGATISYTASAHDLVDGPRVTQCTPASGLFPVGTTVVSCSAADSRGNAAHGSFTVTVTAAPAQPPQLNLPNDMTVEATGPNGAVVTYKVSSSGGDGDDENGRPQANTTCAPASGSTFALGTTSVQCTATNSGGSTSGSFNVTVVDTTGPQLTIPRDFTVQATSNDGIAVTYDASANDLVDGSIAVTCSPASGSTFPVGTTAVSCSASDSHGNSSSGGFSVTVTAPDDPPTPPELNLPDDITVEADGPGGAIVTFTVTTTGGGSNGPDDENGRPTNGSPAVTCTPASGSLFALGTTTVQCTAGSASGTFLVHVVDTTAPVLSLPADITTDETTVTFDASATDLVDGNVAVTCTPSSGSTFPVGTTAVNCSASDAAGNSASGSFNVTVNDSTPARVITVTASPDKLWPPDHKMVAVTISVTISDSSAFTAKILTVSSSENDPNDNTSPDWVITGPLTLNLRAEKSEQAQKRVYTIVVEVIDDTNTAHHKTVTVSVQNASSISQLLRTKSTTTGAKPTNASRPRLPKGRW